MGSTTLDYAAKPVKLANVSCLASFRWLLYTGPPAKSEY